uniref:Uncharacterized protein n=1 Tax=Vibrio pelagius TaxID=28169 RepID=Q9ALI0_VIBPE|nr:unknown [Vibrio pelagius]
MLHDFLTSGGAFFLLVVLSGFHFYRKWQSKTYIGFSFILTGSLSFVCMNVHRGNSVIWFLSLVLLFANLILHKTRDKKT